MRAIFSKLAIALAFAGPLAAGNLSAAETLKFGGTGSAIQLLRQVGAQFTAASEVMVEVVPSLGSTGAISALADGKLDVAVSARPLKAEETAKGLNQVAVLRTAYVLATPHPNPKGFKAADFPRIFSAEKSVWPDGTPLRIILRPRSEADSALLAALFPGMGDAIEGMRRRADVPVAATDQDNVDLAERTPGALIGTTLAQLKTENRKLHVVPLDGVAPTLASFESGAYPFTKKLYFIVRANSSPETQRFVEFLRSPQGVKALRATDTLTGTE